MTPCPATEDAVETAQVRDCCARSIVTLVAPHLAPHDWSLAGARRMVVLRCPAPVPMVRAMRALHDAGYRLIISDAGGLAIIVTGRTGRTGRRRHADRSPRFDTVHDALRP